MKRKILLFCCVLCVLTSCKSLISTKNTSKIDNQVLLGSVGVTKRKALKKEFIATAFPNYNQKVKLSVKKVPFTKNNYKDFLINSNIHPTFKNLDSVDVPNYYLKLTLEDRVALLKNINNTTNKSMLTYLSKQKKSSIILQVDVVFSKSDMEALINSNLIFLAEQGQKNYVLQVYHKTNKVVDTILLSKGLVLKNSKASFCWQENNKHQLQVVNIATHKGCPKNTYKKSLKAVKKTIDFSKF